MKAWNSIPPQRPTHFRSYLGKIARNLSLNKHQENRTKKRGGYKNESSLDSSYYAEGASGNAANTANSSGGSEYAENSSESSPTSDASELPNDTSNETSKEPSNETLTETSNIPADAKAKTLVDYYYKSEMPRGRNIDFELEEYPGVIFRWNDAEFAAIKDNEKTVLVKGMPVWNAFAVDLNGDKKPEFCVTFTIGSGLIDDRICVIDYANNHIYSIENRGVYDFVAFVSEGQLKIERRPFTGVPRKEDSSENTVYGSISLSSSTLTITFDNGEGIGIVY